jgi:molybdenum cofactor biosynthesis enzyme MoaA
MLFEKTTTTQVNAVLFKGENVAEVIDLFATEHAKEPQFTVMEGSIQGEKLNILVIRYLNKKNEERKLTVSNGKYVVMGARTVTVQDKEKFEKVYDRI